MRKYLFISTIFYILFFISTCSSCYECKKIKYCPLPPMGEKYFHAYKENSYWIYYNTDTTKVDSVYLFEYQFRRMTDNTEECYEWDDATFILESNYLSDEKIEGIYGNNGHCEKSNFFLNNLPNKNDPISLDSESNSNFFSSGDLSSQIEQIDTFRLRMDFNFIYLEVINYNDRYWFAPEVGLIQYISYDDQDTFYIHKYQKP